MSIAWKTAGEQLLDQPLEEYEGQMGDLFELSKRAWMRKVQADALHWAAMVVLDDRGEIAAYDAIKAQIARLERGEDGQT